MRLNGRAYGAESGTQIILFDRCDRGTFGREFEARQTAILILTSQQFFGVSSSSGPPPPPRSLANAPMISPELTPLGGGAASHNESARRVYNPLFLPPRPKGSSFPWQGGKRACWVIDDDDRDHHQRTAGLRHHGLPRFAASSQRRMPIIFYMTTCAESPPGGRRPTTVQRRNI